MNVWITNNWVTIASIFLSGIVSLIISSTYYSKGNRNNLEMVVILPIINLFKEKFSFGNFILLSNLSKNYCVRYMKENEKLVLSQLVLAYQNIKNYNEIDMNADILVSYFEYTLKRNDINPKPAPIKDEEDEVVAYDYPPDFHYLFSDIKAVCEKYDPEYQPQKCKEYITSIFTSYTRKYYTDTDLKFFNDHSLEGVLEQSKIKKDWEIKFLAMNNAKNKFLKLKVVKKLVGKNAKNQSEHNNADSLNF